MPISDDFADALHSLADHVVFREESVSNTVHDAIDAERETETPNEPESASDPVIVGDVQ